jgi:methyl-accepting chemotaxis protein
MKKAQIEGYFLERFGDIKVLAANDFVAEALEKFKGSFKANGGKISGGDWESAKSTYGPWLKKYKEVYGYYDLFLITPDGEVVYTVEEEPDLGANLIQGQLKDSGLGKAFNKGQNAPILIDFEPYAPSKGAQAAFIAAPVVRGGRKLGVVALQLPIEFINKTAQRREGMGRTGESFLVGSLNGKIAFRSDMKTMGDGKYVIGYPISTPYTKKALSGKSAQEVYTDTEGNLVMVAYDKLEIPGLEWAMVSKINLEEAIAPRITGAKEDFYARYIKQYGYYDLFLIAPSGEVFYSVTHEADYGTNMVNGKYSGSGLGKLVRRVLETKKYGLANFESYQPSNNEPASFIARPFVQNGKVEVIVALQLSIEAINKIMQERAGMGKTGETYLVGSDKLMRSDSFLDPKNHSVKASFANPQKGKVDTEAVRDALAGKTAKKIIIDYNGNPVLSAFTPLKIAENPWVLIAEIDEAEAFAAVHDIEWIMGVIALVGISAIIIIALFVGRSISKPINQVVTGLTEGAVQVAAAANQVSSASQSLAQGASQQAASLEETSSSIEEMASMTRQNNDNAQQADTLMKEASKIVSTANSSMKQLKDAMGKITSASEETGKIIKTIDEIAFQTNLLALNAAVEAARAGEAGAGFAVVADEVRNLAMRAADAAKNTSSLIEENIKNINDGSDLVINTDGAFSQVEESAKKVGELVSDIAAASQEQTQGIEQINKATGEMDTVTQQVAANAEETAASSEELSAQAETMHGVVERLHQLVEGASAKSSASTESFLPSEGEKDGNHNLLTHEHKPAMDSTDAGKTDEFFNSHNVF